MSTLADTFAPITVDRWGAVASTSAASGEATRLSAGGVSGYDGAEDSKRRRTVSAVLMGEDDHLKAQKRQRLTANGRDLVRNFAIARWAINKHLDFVSSFNFQAKTRDKGLNRDLEAWLRIRSKKENCDRAGRHPLRRFIRLAEARRTIDGDLGIFKLRTAQLQAVEGDRVRDPDFSRLPTGERERWTHGVRTDNGGRATHYAIHRRKPGGGGFEFERFARADRMLHFGYFDRFDQVRGIAPIASALNTYRDVYENFDYALAKAKIGQLFGLKITRNGGEPLGAASEDETFDTDGDGVADASAYKVEFGKGPFLLDMDEGDDADFLENKTPSIEFRDFNRAMISVALKAIDLPFSFYDEAYTNFFGSRAALLLYIKSAVAKRADVQDLLDEITAFWLLQAVGEGAIVLPASIDVDALRWHWAPDGIPWWDPSKEIRADIMSIAAGLRTRAEIRLERFGDDWFDLPDRLAEEEAAIEAAGITITEAAPEIYNAEPVAAAANGDDSNENE